MEQLRAVVATEPLAQAPDAVARRPVECSEMARQPALRPRWRSATPACHQLVQGALLDGAATPRALSRLRMRRSCSLQPEVVVPLFGLAWGATAEAGHPVHGIVVLVLLVSVALFILTKRWRRRQRHPRRQFWLEREEPFAARVQHPEAAGGARRRTPRTTNRAESSTRSLALAHAASKAARKEGSQWSVVFLISWWSGLRPIRRLYPSAVHVRLAVPFL
mmetsp:Transcript_44799/g.124156  ORF Transcript_44799/g.124156 Transcript_44799/m.124156 type:complete len:220 (+) Transcript_44799:626-1285(+)